MRREWVAAGANILLPTLLFYVCYKAWGVVPAAFISMGYSAAAMLLSWIRKKEVGNTQVFGIVASLGAAFVIACTGEGKYYYVPALIQNAVLLAFMLALSIRRKSVLHFLAKDFKIPSLSTVPEDSMLGVSIIWIASSP